MANRRFFIGLAVASIFVIGIWLLGSVPQAMAETMNYKYFNHVTKNEVKSIPNAEGHTVSLWEREGVIILESGELAWTKGIGFSDFTKGAGTIIVYNTLTFQDGSTIIQHSKGTVGASSAGVSSSAKRAGEIIHGTGRFQGIKGTMTTSAKLLPPEKGELGGKSLGEGTITYTLPSK
jgi:hypothetical protein